VGTSNPEHLQENLAAAAIGPLPQDLYQQMSDQIQTLGA
jgi:aryl-alcohol dehydrogenase-like predicted oxidoreductase